MEHETREMNMVWMGIIAGIIFVEKVLPGGVLVSKGVGGLAGCGVLLLTAPHALPALAGV
jgi:predicted metal-binding membrane protein